MNSINSDSFAFEFGVCYKVSYELPNSFLYEPNSAILKSGGFNWVSEHFNVDKLHKHSHLYTSSGLIKNFPGRTFKIIDCKPYNKKELKKRYGTQKFNITTRNFPKSVDTIRKELNIKEGGNQYLFFTTNINNSKIVLTCNKL